MEIEIPFNDWSKERLNLMVKRATSRNKKYGNVGDTFKVGDSKYQIELIVKLPLWFIQEELYESEGCFHNMEFEDIWVQIHPRAGWTPNKEVWYHKFKEIN
jgi:hypothetical protein